MPCWKLRLATIRNTHNFVIKPKPSDDVKSFKLMRLIFLFFFGRSRSFGFALVVGSAAWVTGAQVNAYGQTAPRSNPEAPVRLETRVAEHSNDLGIDDLIKIQGKIKQVLKRVLPCVVAIEGGSGVVVSRDGLILTASHVAGRAGRSVQVRFQDGRVVRATTLGTNSSTDASALQISSPGPWPHLTLARNPKLQAGDWCLAFGYPSSYPRNTHASLRVGRILKTEEQELTTDCLLMGGDSGGPLVNLDGEIIGINSRVKNQIDENFHIPSSVFVEEWNRIVKANDVRERASPTGQRPYLGLNAETDSERIRIRKVHTNSPAESAGLKPEDVILQFDGTPVSDFDQILRMVDGREPGETVTLIINRSGRLLKKYLVLGQHY